MTNTSSVRGVQQLPRPYAQRLSQLFKDRHGGIAGAALDAADIGAMKPGFEGELFLGPAALAPDFDHVEAKLLADIHPVSNTGCILSVYRL